MVSIPLRLLANVMPGEIRSMNALSTRVLPAILVI